MNNPKISILGISYNHENFIKYYTESILNQTEGDFELIIVDDCSTDNNVSEIQKFNDPRIKLIRHDFNKGINSSLNTAFENSCGEYIVILATDDIAEPELLKTSTDYLDKNPDTGVFYSSLSLIDYNNKIIPDPKNIYIRCNKSKYDLLNRCFYYGNCLLSPGMVIRRKEFEKLYPLNPAMVQYQDYQMHINLMLNTNVYLSEEKLVRYRLPSDISGISARKFTTIKREQLEQDSLMDTFLRNGTFEDFKKIFNEDFHKYGNPVDETLPYILGRLAMDSDNEYKQNWGYKTVMKFIQNFDNYNLLHKLYNFNFKEYLNLVNKFEKRQDKLLAKINKYKRLFTTTLILSAVIIISMIILLLA